MNGQTAQNAPLDGQERLDLETHLERVRKTLPAGNVVAVEFDPASQAVRYRMTDGEEKTLPARSVLAGINAAH